MSVTKTSEEIDRNRRHFLGAAAMTFAATRLGLIGSAQAQPGETRLADLRTVNRGTNTSFGPLKQIEAGVLNTGYAEAGPANGRPVILLHGWPYDIHSFVDVAPLLAAKGYRVIVPYLRGYGSTRFLSDDGVRNGQQSAVAVDIIALMDALKIDKAIIGGFDWGARTANIIAALWPQRCGAMVSVSGLKIYGRGHQAACGERRKNAEPQQHCSCHSPSNHYDYRRESHLPPGKGSGGWRRLGANATYCRCEHGSRHVRDSMQHRAKECVPKWRVLELLLWTAVEIPLSG